jgi:hypothetical protein
MTAVLLLYRRDIGPVFPIVKSFVEVSHGTFDATHYPCRYTPSECNLARINFDSGPCGRYRTKVGVTLGTFSVAWRC